jgi:outer membrane lipoprotein carrier protein
MTIRLKWQSLALFLALAPGFAWAAQPDLSEIAHAVDDHYDHIRTLEAQFTEIYQGSGMSRTESGTLWLKKPGKMRWEYRSPKAKLFVSDGQTGWFYVPAENQARRMSMKKLDDLRSPLGLLLGKAKLEKELRGLSLAPDESPMAPGDVLLRGVPRGLEGRVNEVLLEVNPAHEIVRIVLDQEDGSTTEYEFRDQKADIPVEEKSFHFSPPAGVEVTDESLDE